MKLVLRVLNSVKGISINRKKIIIQIIIVTLGMYTFLDIQFDVDIFMTWNDYNKSISDRFFQVYQQDDSWKNINSIPYTVPNTHVYLCRVPTLKWNLRLIWFQSVLIIFELSIWIFQCFHNISTSKRSINMGKILNMSLMNISISNEFIWK